MEVRSADLTEHDVEPSRFLQIVEMGSIALIADGVRALRHVVRTSTMKKIKVLYLSHCGAEWLGRTFGAAAYMRGMPVAVSSSTHDDRGRIEEVQPDLGSWSRST